MLQGFEKRAWSEVERSEEERRRRSWFSYSRKMWKTTGAGANWFAAGSGSKSFRTRPGSTLVPQKVPQEAPAAAVVAVPAHGDRIIIPAEFPPEKGEEEEEEEDDEHEDLLENKEEPNSEDDQELVLPELGPQLLFKEQLEKDNEDESLRRWKEQLLGSAASCLLDAAGGENGFLEPEVKVLRLGIQAKGREELELPLDPQLLLLLTTSSTSCSFSLKEGCHYHLKFVFTVRSNIVSGLTCINTVWKLGIMVDQTRSMLGTFAPQQEPYVHIMPEAHVIPSGSLARGTYTANLRFLDDDAIVYLDVNYSFQICKDW